MMSRKLKTAVLSVAVVSICILAGRELSVLNAGEKAERMQARQPLPQKEEVMKLSADGGEKFNRLVHEKSPYLLQHARNPVDWYPWGEEAFAKAKAEDKPIFLSVGYSTCHWCHVMEHESFESKEIAAIMNEHFVCIKVDREERPDVDKVYMNFVQATTGGGGWPMSVWLTPNLKPFYGGTYYPPEDKWGRPGFASILKQLADGWKSNKQNVINSSEGVTAQLEQYFVIKKAEDFSPSKTLLDTGYSQIKASYEPRFGGFGSAPKFPRPVSYNFMLRYYHRTRTQDALDMTLFTLQKMADGGMHDHLGGGFHRYSTDDRWHIPHFEKMLYDQAQLVWSYLEAYQITKDKSYSRVCDDILQYVIRDMTAKDGAFYSAEDADSPIPENPGEQAEGAFYVWEYDQIKAVLGAEDAKIFNYIYEVKKSGNARSDPHGEFKKKNTLIVVHTLKEAADKFGSSPGEIEDKLQSSRDKLFNIREQRPRPHLDDKVLTSWNGLIISGFARAYQVLENEKYRDAALKAVSFIRRELYDSDTGILTRRYRDGESAIDGYLDDYAYLIQGLLDVYEATFDISHLEWASDLQGQQNALFWDEDNGGFFSTSGKDSSILMRLKNDYDGAEPSANSIALTNLLRLAQMTDNTEYRTMAEATIKGFGSRLKNTPSAMPQMLAAIEFFMDTPKQIVIAGAVDDPRTREMLRSIHSRFIPNKILLVVDRKKGAGYLENHLEFVKNLKMIDDRPTAYVCENYVCQLPTSDLKTLENLLARKK